MKEDTINSSIDNRLSWTVLDKLGCVIQRSGIYENCNMSWVINVKNKGGFKAF